MDCPRGSVCTETEHEVKTLRKAQEWLPGCDEGMLPIIVNQVISSNGRQVITIYDKHGEVMSKRG